MINNKVYEELKRETNYFYSIGSLEGIKEGNSEKYLLTRKKIDFKDLFVSKENNLILVPKIIGIYQCRKRNFDNPSDKHKWEKAIEYSNAAIDLSISAEWRITDTINRDLIHIIFDPELISQNLIRKTLKDNLNRVGVSTLDNSLNFYEKDIYSVYELLSQSNDSRQGKEDPAEIEPEVLNASFVKLKPKAREVLGKIEPYGLTRDEWYNINSFFLFD